MNNVIHCIEHKLWDEKEEIFISLDLIHNKTENVKKNECIFFFT